MDWVWWLAAALLLGVIQVLTVDLIFLMFAGGALAATITAAVGGPVWAQIVAFGLVSSLLLVAVRPWAMRKFAFSTPETATNVAAHIGRHAMVVADVSDRAGRVKLAGEVWTARLEGAGVIPVGASVQVVRIDGATAVIAPYTAADTGLADPSAPPGSPLY